MDDDAVVFVVLPDHVPARDVRVFESRGAALRHIEKHSAALVVVQRRVTPARHRSGTLPGVGRDELTDGPESDAPLSCPPRRPSRRSLTEVE